MEKKCNTASGKKKRGKILREPLIAIVVLFLFGKKERKKKLSGGDDDDRFRIVGKQKMLMIFFKGENHVTWQANEVNPVITGLIPSAAKYK